MVERSRKGFELGYVMRFVFLGDHAGGRWDGEANGTARAEVRALVKAGQEYGGRILDIRVREGKGQLGSAL